MTEISYSFLDAQRPRNFVEQDELAKHPLFDDLEHGEFVPCLHLPPECVG